MKYILRRNIRSSDIITVCHDKIKFCKHTSAPWSFAILVLKDKITVWEDKLIWSWLTHHLSRTKLAKKGMDRYPKDSLWRLLTKSTRFNPTQMEKGKRNDVWQPVKLKEKFKSSSSNRKMEIIFDSNQKLSSESPRSTLPVSVLKLTGRKS